MPNESEAKVKWFDGEELLNGFEANGGWVDRQLFELVSFQGMGYGARALCPIKAHTPLFHIPIAHVLSAETSRLRSLLSEAEWASLSGWLPLMLVMMYEQARGEDSPWHAYLKNMPSHFDSPMFWSDQELVELKGTDIFDRIGRKSAEENYQRVIVPILRAHPEVFLESSPHYTLDSFHVQGSRILSRSFTVPVLQASDPEDAADDDSETGADQPAMMPIADMLNAGYRRENARLFSSEEADASAEAMEQFGNGFTMITTRDIPSGEQIVCGDYVFLRVCKADDTRFNTYNSPPNSELLRKYGHVDIFPLSPEILNLLPSEAIGDWPQGNPGDEVTIDGHLVLAAAAMLGYAPQDAEEQKARIDAWLDDDQEDMFACSFLAPLDPSLTSFIHILISEDEWRRFQRKGKLPKPALNDKRVTAVWAEVLQQRLGRYETTLRDDLRLLASQISERHRNALVVRIGEKRILTAARQALLSVAAGRKRSTPEASEAPPDKRQR